MLAFAAPESLGVAAGAILFATLFCVAFLQGLVLVLRCPESRPGPPALCARCRRGTLERVAATRAGGRYYRCALCGARAMRSTLGGPWQDASAPEHDPEFLSASPNADPVNDVWPFDVKTYGTR